MLLFFPFNAIGERQLSITIVVIQRDLIMRVKLSTINPYETTRVARVSGV